MHLNSNTSLALLCLPSSFETQLRAHITLGISLHDTGCINKLTATATTTTDMCLIQRAAQEQQVGSAICLYFDVCIVWCWQASMSALFGSSKYYTALNVLDYMCGGLVWVTFDDMDVPGSTSTILAKYHHSHRNNASPNLFVDSWRTCFQLVMCQLGCVRQWKWPVSTCKVLQPEQSTRRTNRKWHCNVWWHVLDGTHNTGRTHNRCAQAIFKNGSAECRKPSWSWLGLANDSRHNGASVLHNACHPLLLTSWTSGHQPQLVHTFLMALPLKQYHHKDDASTHSDGMGCMFWPQTWDGMPGLYDMFIANQVWLFPTQHPACRTAAAPLLTTHQPCHHGDHSEDA